MEDRSVQPFASRIERRDAMESRIANDESLDGSERFFEDSEDYKSYWIDPYTRGFEITLRLRDRTGKSTGFGYNYLVSADCDAGEGSEIVLHFTTGTVTLKGKKLRPLYELLCDHRAKYVQEFNPMFHKQPGEEDTVVESMRVTGR